MEMQVGHVDWPILMRELDAYETVHAWAFRNSDPYRASTGKLSMTKKVWQKSLPSTINVKATFRRRGSAPLWTEMRRSSGLGARGG